MENSKLNYAAPNEIAYNIKQLKSSLCNYNDAWILARGDITVTSVGATQIAFKNCGPFTKCIAKTDRTTIDNDENLGLVIPMYNLIEYSSNSFETAGNVLFYFKDKATALDANIANTNDFKSFKDKAKLLGIEFVRIVVPLKYFK